MTGSPVTSLAIGIASSPGERAKLARLLGGSEAFLIVSTIDQARKFLDIVETAPEGPVAPAETPPASGPWVDSDRRMLRFREHEVGLTRLEHDLLRCLLGAPGQVWTYERLHQEVWGNAHLGRGSDMHSVVRRARAKLARLNAAATIHSVRGVGFRYAA